MSNFKVEYDNQVITSCHGANLRLLLLSKGLSPYNGKAKILNCRGLGSCGTCAVTIVGKVNPETFMEKWRLSFPPHKPGSGLRLACQVKVEGDLKVTKGKGFWGEK
jgi:ferredoxin